MVEIEYQADKLVLHERGIDKLLAFKSTLEIPYSHITSVSVGVEPRAWMELQGSIRVGTAVGHTVMGSYRYHGEWMFWDIRSPERALTIQLAHDEYKKLIIEAADPAATVAAIQAKLTR